jgi:hypothetical protein
MAGLAETGGKAGGNRGVEKAEGSRSPTSADQHQHRPGKAYMHNSCRIMILSVPNNTLSKAALS